jgi:hypothetical protein
MVDYSVYFKSSLDVPALSDRLAKLVGAALAMEDKGDYLRCYGARGPLWIACWSPHGMENDNGIPFENFDTVISVSSPGELQRQAGELARTLLGWVVNEQDRHAILVRDVQEIISRHDAA